MALATALVWLAALYRIGLTLSGPGSLWRRSFTAAITLLAVGVTFSTFPGLSDTIVPNSSSLLVHASITVAAGCVLTYLVTLLHVVPPQGAVNTIAFITIVALIIQVASWVASPIHDHNLGNLALASPHPALLTYFMAFYAHLVLTLCASFATCTWLVFRGARDPTSRVGLTLIAIATLAGALGFASFAARAAFTLTSRADHPALGTLGTMVGPVAVAGIGLGTLTFLVGPGLSTWLETRRTVRALTPLHHQLCDQHPEVTISPNRPWSAEQHRERMFIEIHDALSRTFVLNADSSRDPYLTIAKTIKGGSQLGLLRASALLPPATDRNQDRAVLLTLARTYEEA